MEKTLAQTFVPHLAKFRSKRLTRLLSYKSDRSGMTDEQTVDFEHAQENFIYEQGMDHYNLNLLPRVG